MVGHIKNLESIRMTHADIKDASMKVLFSPQEGWEGYVMRLVEVGAFGYTPKHSHPWPHINYMVEGDGELLIDGEIFPVTKGSFAFVEGHKLHQFRNAGEAPFKFICIVPEEGHKI